MIIQEKNLTNGDYYQYGRQWEQSTSPFYMDCSGINEDLNYQNYSEPIDEDKDINNNNISNYNFEDEDQDIKNNKNSIKNFILEEEELNDIQSILHESEKIIQNNLASKISNNKTKDSPNFKSEKNNMIDKNPQNINNIKFQESKNNSNSEDFKNISFSQPYNYNYVTSSILNLKCFYNSYEDISGTFEDYNNPFFNISNSLINYI